MNKVNYEEVKKNALEDFGVVSFDAFNVKKAIRERMDYLKSYIKSNNLKAIVLGISGGVDSFTAGKISQLAMNELKNEGYDAMFVAVRLPSGVQKDEDEAMESISIISPDKVHSVNIGYVSNVMSQSVVDSFENVHFDEKKVDFHRGNVKARMRMIAQYELAGLYGGVVLGTDHNAEGVLAFYTYH